MNPETPQVEADVKNSEEIIEPEVPVRGTEVKVNDQNTQEVRFEPEVKTQELIQSEVQENTPDKSEPETEIDVSAQTNTIEQAYRLQEEINSLQE